MGGEARYPSLYTSSDEVRWLRAIFYRGNRGVVHDFPSLMTSWDEVISCRHFFAGIQGQ